MTDEASVAERLAAVRGRVAEAATRSGRSPDDITLVGVSKRQPAERIVAAVRAGLTDLAENYVQEAVAKIPPLMSGFERSGASAPRWHFIGQLQRNKARDVVRWFDRIATLDRERLGDELERRAATADRRLEVLVQVNVSGEAQKGGVEPDALPALLAASTRWKQLRVVGLMAIPAAEDDPEAVRPAFARLRALRDASRALPGGEQLRELSMGMSGDFEVAIEEGATEVRVGTAIFGPRSDA